MKAFLFSLLGIAILAGCTDSPDFSDTPNIEFRAVFGDRIAQSTDRDTIQFEIYYEDGDGDLGGGDGDLQNIYMYDSRDGSTAFTFNIPRIPEQGAGNGVKGELLLLAIFQKGDICCLFPNGQSPCTPSLEYPVDTFYYETVMYDRAGNESNRVMAGPVFIDCDDPN